jgi:uncharacterized protein YbbC (DUF1343 family)
MTIGELALLFNKEFHINAKLSVVWMKHYNRALFFDKTGLVWVSPSPNLTSLDSALLYSELGWLETVNLSMGRGTKTPFQLIGAPFIDGNKVAKLLEKTQCEGLSVVAARFIPKAKYHIYAHRPCGGVRVTVKSQENQAFKCGVELLKIVLKLYPKQIRLSKDFALMSGSKELEKLIRASVPFDQIEKRAEESRVKFEKLRKRYLYYK